MGFLNEMATAWSLYLSFGVIFIFSECAFTEITSNDLAKKNYTNSNGMTDRNVSSTTPKLSKLSTAKMNTKTNLSAARSNGSEMLDSASFIGISNNATEKITHETYGSENTNERTSHKHPSSVSLQTIAYASTTPSILRFKKNETKANTDEDEKENLYIGFRNQDDAFKNVKKSTKKSIENQFSSGFVLPNIVASSAYDALKENISSQNTHKTLTHSTLPIKNDSSMRKWKLSTAKPANTPSSELFFSINQTFAPSVKTFPDTTFEKLPSSTLPNEILSEFTQETITNRDVLYNSSSTNQIQNSTFLFDLKPLRKNAHVGNLTSNNTADKNYPTSYDQSTIHTAKQTLHRQNKTANVAQTEILGITEVALDNGSVAVTEREWLATNTKNNFTSQFTPSKMQLININNSITNDNYVSTKLFVNHSISHVHPSHSSTLKNHTLNETKVNETRSINKEHLQFPGITLKVSHVLIPKQKRSRYNIRNMKIQLPKNELLNQPSAATPKNSNCTRFPIQVVTASDTETNEKVNLTEEHYDCEYSSELNNTQKEPAVSVHSYFSSYVFRYAVPNKVNLSISNQTANDTVRSTVPPYSDENDDYYSSYMEYSDPTNGSSNTDVEDGIIPDPDMNKVVTKTKPEALSVPIADTSITDNDLHDHDVIDSVMYIYFGGTAHGQHGAGRQIIIVGAVIALVAQFLTLASSIRRIKTHYGEEPSIVLLNIETALTLTNLTFILGVQSTSDHTLCKIIAVSLYYFHITALFWFLLSSVHSVQTVCHIEKPFKLYTFCIIGWILPFFITLTSYVVNERSFETNLYCWVSPLRGILISYIAPVILFCIICIILTVIGLKNITETTEDFDDTYSHKKLLRISAVALPLFSIIWFTGMVSLENSASLLFSLIFLMSNTVLNWLLFACWLPSEASQWKDMDEDYYDEEEDFDDEPVLVKRRFDDQPLLSELYEYGAQGQLYNLRVEPISIISTP